MDEDVSIRLAEIGSGPLLWNPIRDGNLMVTGRGRSGKTWWLHHRLLPALRRAGVDPVVFDGRREPADGVPEPGDALLIVDHVEPSRADALRRAAGRRPMVVLLEYAPDPMWDGWNRLEMPHPGEWGPESLGRWTGRSGNVLIDF